MVQTVKMQKYSAYKSIHSLECFALLLFLQINHNKQS